MQNKNKRPKNKKGQPHGYWEVYHYNGKLDFKAIFVKGQPHGYWEVYHYNGKLDFKGYYAR